MTCRDSVGWLKSVLFGFGKGLFANLRRFISLRGEEDMQSCWSGGDEGRYGEVWIG